MSSRDMNYYEGKLHHEEEDKRFDLRRRSSVASIEEMEEHLKQLSANMDSYKSDIQKAGNGKEQQKQEEVEENEEEQEQEEQERGGSKKNEAETAAEFHPPPMAKNMSAPDVINGSNVVPGTKEEIAEFQRRRRASIERIENLEAQLRRLSGSVNTFEVGIHKIEDDEDVIEKSISTIKDHIDHPVKR